MSQSATFYSISSVIFGDLEQSNGEKNFDPSNASDYCTCQGTFMAIEYILSKGQNKKIAELMQKLFNPPNAIGSELLDNLSMEEQFEFYESGRLIPYLDPHTILEINEYFNTVTENYLQDSYDAKELNNNGIYPNVWQTENKKNEAFNLNHLTEDFNGLKSILNLSAKEGNYLLVFVG